MLINKELAEVAPQKDALLTIGVFDGVHLGHKHLITRVKELARAQGLLSGIVTFRSHPQDMLSPETPLPYLTGLARRLELLKAEKADFVVALTFNAEMARLGAREFVDLLKKYLRMGGLIVGPDFALGRNREGDIGTLRRLGKELEFSVTVVPPLISDGQVISSTAIRSALARGDMKTACLYLGRPFRLQGSVVSGDHRGTGLGFPTANMNVAPEQALPADGVYATLARIDGKAFPSLTNIGKRPTFGGKERTIEVYVLDYVGDLYGREMAIDVVERLREEKHFASSEELKHQISQDIERGKAILAQVEKRMS